MNSSITQRLRVAGFLLNIAEWDRHLEVVRQILNGIDSFEPYAAFLRITRGKGTGITCKDLENFLRENAVPLDINSLEVVIKIYDTKFTGVLDFEDFLKTTLTRDNPSIRFEAAATREIRDMPVDQNLTEEVEYTLSRLFGKACEFTRKMRIDAESQSVLADRDLFTQLGTGSGASTILDFKVLKKFFENLKIVPKDSEIIAILRVIDINDDGVIDRNEFDYFVGLFTSRGLGDNGLFHKLKERSKRENETNYFGEPRTDSQFLKSTLNNSISASGVQPLRERPTNYRRDDTNTLSSVGEYKPRDRAGLGRPEREKNISNERERRQLATGSRVEEVERTRLQRTETRNRNLPSPRTGAAGNSRYEKEVGDLRKWDQNRSTAKISDSLLKERTRGPGTRSGSRDRSSTANKSRRVDGLRPANIPTGTSRLERSERVDRLAGQKVERGEGWRRPGAESDKITFAGSSGGGLADARRAAGEPTRERRLEDFSYKRSAPLETKKEGEASSYIRYERMSITKGQADRSSGVNGAGQTYTPITRDVGDEIGLSTNTFRETKFT